ncbi:hypothetical protein ACFL0Y_00520 [Patescibacteria group bacterium]
MNNKILMYVGIALFVGVLGGYAITQSKQANTQTSELSYGNGVGQGQNGQPDRGNCLADDCLLVDDLEYPVGELSPEVQSALDEAINDEYKALSTYESVIAKFGSVRPFSMIKGAEEQHIASLKAIYDKYGLEVPSNTWPSKVSAPATLQEACQIGVDAEIANAALYKDELLPAVEGYEDIVAVFTNLMNASEQKHLPAFDRCN